MLHPAGKTPLVDTSQAEGFNMSVLKRMDEDILEILYSATHVAVYEFDTSRKSWKRSDIEGTLFLVKRCSAPRFRMIVVNSKRIDNFMEEVDGSLECDVLQTFLLYTRGNNQLYGIWFYDEKNCEEFGNYLKRIVKGMPKASPSGTPTIRDKTPSAMPASIADKQRSPSDLRNELQSIFNQLNGQSGGGTSSGAPLGSSSSNLGGGSRDAGQKSMAVTSGESDHLMRLFLQAHERSPASSAPLTVATTTAVNTTPAAAAVVSPQMSPKLPNADVVLSLDTNILPVTTMTTPTAAGTSLLPTASLEHGTVSSPALPTVPLVPLPPDFFKPSGKASGVPHMSEDVLGGVAPDPVTLPVPLTEAVTSTQTHAREIGLLGATTSGAMVDGNGLCSATETDSAVPSSLARFFAKNEHSSTPNGSHEINGSDGVLRDRFRQALVNLLSNDDILDLLIAEFKKVGIPIQSLQAPPPPQQPRQ